jgi:hypothetical protein
VVQIQDAVVEEIGFDEGCALDVKTVADRVASRIRKRCG